MGGASSKVDGQRKTMSDADWELDVLGYSEADLQKLRKIFNKASTGDKVDEGDIGRILFIFGLEGNRFMRHLFSMVECAENCITFRDLVVMLFYFCTTVDDYALGITIIYKSHNVNKYSFLPCCSGLFVFEMFDLDHNGLLDYPEFDHMMMCIFGSKRPMGGVMKQ